MKEQVRRTLEEMFNYGLRRVNDRLAYARVKADITQEEVAEYKNVHVRTVQRWETREFWGNEKELSKDKKARKQALIMDLAEFYNASYPWMSYRYGSENDDFEQGLEYVLIKDAWHKLPREKQKATFLYIKSMMS